MRRAAVVPLPQADDAASTAAAAAALAAAPPGTRRRIVVVSLGTRGDAQPLLAVAQALQAEGASVLFLCMSPFCALGESCGVPSAPLGHGMDELLESCEEARALRAARTPWGKMRALDAFIRRLSRDHWRAADAAFAAFRPDTALLHGVAFFALSSLCELRGVKLAVAHCVPPVPTSQLAPPFFCYRGASRSQAFRGQR